jgi:hypothetical protein
VLADKPLRAARHHGSARAGERVRQDREPSRGVRGVVSVIAATTEAPGTNESEPSRRVRYITPDEAVTATTETQTTHRTTNR